MPLVGFLFDTTLAEASLVFSGVPKRYPRIRWVMSHLGGRDPFPGGGAWTAVSRRSRNAAAISTGRPAPISNSSYYER